MAVGKCFGKLCQLQWGGAYLPRHGEKQDAPREDEDVPQGEAEAEAEAEAGKTPEKEIAAHEAEA